MKAFGKRLYLFLIVLFLYAPILTMAVLSFNDSKTRGNWSGFTGKWYLSLFENEGILNALSTTFTIALLSSVLATCIGVLASVGIQAFRSHARTAILAVTNLPMLNADIVTGISLMLLFLACRFTLGYVTVLVAHITFNIPYVILSVLPRLQKSSKRTYEAALDLGASPLQAFLKVTLPDILPGIFSGFLLAFTMSLDDFVITHFTKGPGVDTLSTKIYSEVRKGIQPEMYALSTLLFALVLLLLFLVNYASKETKNSERNKKCIRRKIKKSRLAFLFTGRLLPVALILLFVAGGFYYSDQKQTAKENQLIVYNWGEYIDPQVITLFEEETGIQVIYEEFETNEIMYPKIQSNAIAYDVVCPSDYMIQRMIEQDLLSPLEYEKLPNASYIGETYWEFSSQFDENNTYSVPYCWGTVGILYNDTMVTEEVTSWEILWDSTYQDNILMQDSVRDTMGVALKSLGYSLNSTDLDELTEANEKLLEQKSLVQAYVIDQVRDKMINEEAALGVIYSGEALYTQSENSHLQYVVPDEGSNVWIDSWVIPKNAKNKDNAHAWIDFLCRPEIAKMNFDYILYSTPNEGAKALIEDSALQESEVLFPDEDTLKNCEVLRYLGDDANEIYQEFWRKLKSQ